MRQIADLARLLDWRVYHTYDSRRSPFGFPDLVLVKGRLLVFAELKVGDRKPTPSQEAWLTVLRLASADARLWRPDDWPEIETLLKSDAVYGPKRPSQA